MTVQLFSIAWVLVVCVAVLANTIGEDFTEDICTDSCSAVETHNVGKSFRRQSALLQRNGVYIAKTLHPLQVPDSVSMALPFLGGDPHDQCGFKLESTYMSTENQNKNRGANVAQELPCASYSDYAALHHDIIAGRRIPRYLVFNAGSMGQGLGYMTIGLSLAFWLAAASGRALLIDWRVPIPITEVFEPVDGAPDWRLTDRLIWKTTQIPGSMPVTIHDFDFDTYSSSKDLRDAVFMQGPGTVFVSGNHLRAIRDEHLLPDIPGGCSFFHYVHQKARALMSNASFLHQGGQVDEDDAVVLKEWKQQGVDAMLHGCAWRYLMKPTPAFDQKLKAFRTQLPPHASVLAMHLRVGDWALDGNKRDKRLEKKHLLAHVWGSTESEIARSATACGIAKLLEHGQHIPVADRPCAVIFISDSATARQSVKQLHGAPNSCEVLVPSGNAAHTRLETSESDAFTAWQDFVVMAHADLLMVVTKSSFSHSAGLLGARFSHIDQDLRFSAGSVCGGSAFLNLSTIETQSGLDYVRDFLEH